MKTDLLEKKNVTHGQKVFFGRACTSVRPLNVHLVLAYTLTDSTKCVAHGDRALCVDEKPKLAVLHSF